MTSVEVNAKIEDELGKQLVDEARASVKPWGRCFVCGEELERKPVSMDMFSSDVAALGRHRRMLASRHAACSPSAKSAKSLFGSFRATGLIVGETLPVIVVSVAGDHYQVDGGTSDKPVWPQTLLDSLSFEAMAADQVEDPDEIPTPEHSRLTVEDGELLVEAPGCGWRLTTNDAMLDAMDYVGGVMVSVSFRYDAQAFDKPAHRNGFLTGSQSKVFWLDYPGTLVP